MKNYAWKIKSKNFKSTENQYNEYDLLDGEPVDAIYRQLVSEELSLNPLIAALPPAREDNLEIVRDYTKFILGYNYDIEKNLSINEKIMRVNELKTQFRVCLTFQLALENAFHSSLVNSYALRSIKYNPDVDVPIVTNSTQSNSHFKIWGDEADSANSSFALLGYSGCGKTTSLHQLLSRYPQVIKHKPSKGEEFVQVVYLVVNCSTNSNFNELYSSIGRALDKALCNLTPVYEILINKQKNLANKKAKIVELIETFSIGMILLDEIQLIDFKSTKENSYESLLTFVNKTKVSISVIGTEDAYEKMFSNLRNTRRIGQVIDASSYTSSKSAFKSIVHLLSQYQWFDSRVEFTDDIVDALYKCTHGIIDQLINLYVSMHLEYFLKKGSKPKIDSSYVVKISKKYFPALQRMNEQLTDYEKNSILFNASENFKDKFETELEKAKLELSKPKLNQEELTDILTNEKELEDQVFTNLKPFGFSETIVDKAFKKTLKENKSYHELDIIKLTQLVTKNVFKLMDNAKPKKQKKPKVSVDQMLSVINGGNLNEQ